MAEVFFWADFHFGHPKVSDLRGFNSTDEHDNHIVKGWESRVGKKDQVVVPGDLAVGSPQRALEIIAGLPGIKRLISGNHDQTFAGNRKAPNAQKRYLEVFDSVQDYAKRRVHGVDYLLSHFPYTGDHAGTEDRYTEFRLKDTGKYPLIHGHVHDEWKVNGMQFNVGVDHWMDGPASAEDIHELYKKEKYG